MPPFGHSPNVRRSCNVVLIYEGFFHFIQKIKINEARGMFTLESLEHLQHTPKKGAIEEFNCRHTWEICSKSISTVNFLIRSRVCKPKYQFNSRFRA